MKFFLPIAAIAFYALVALSLAACSNDRTTAGIEIGNPSIADNDTTAKDTLTKHQPELPLVADFSVDYADVSPKALAKSASQDEPVLLDTFSLVLTKLYSFASYYYLRPPEYDMEMGNALRLWPYEYNSDEELNISFTQNSSVEDAFKDIDLQEEGFLKEIGVLFRPDETTAIFGRAKIGDKYIPFVYSLSNFQSLMLRYHYSQIDTAGGKANLSVAFRVKTFTNGIDFTTAEIGEDSVIHIDSKFNSDLWNKLNEQFVPSFQPLRYDYKTATGDSVSAYIDDVWKSIAAGVKENTIINGNFQSPFTTDWILMNQFGGKADTTVLIEKGSNERIMKVEVIAGGSHSYSVQLLQENVALIEGIQYQCVFTIWSDVEGQITARIGSYDTYETIGFQEHVQVHTTGQSVAITFTPIKSDPFARFELNLGGSERTFWIKEVKVIRLN